VVWARWDRELCPACVLLLMSPTRLGTGVMATEGPERLLSEVSQLTARLSSRQTTVAREVPTTGERILLKPERAGPHRSAGRALRAGDGHSDTPAARTLGVLGTLALPHRVRPTP